MRSAAEAPRRRWLASALATGFAAMLAPAFFAACTPLAAPAAADGPERFRADYWLETRSGPPQFEAPPADADWSTRSETFLRPFPEDARMWARIRMSPAASAAQLVLVHPDPRADQVDFFLMSDNRIERIQPDGDSRAHAWPRPFLAPALFFEAPAGSERSVYVRLGNAVDLSLQFELYEEDEFYRMARQRYFFQAAFFGVIFVLIFFYSAAYFSLKLPLLGHYAVYMLALCAYFLSRSGCLAQYIAPGAPWILNQATAPLPGLIFCCGLGFIRSFLALRELRPRLDRIVRTAQWVALTPLALVIFSRPLAILAGDLISLSFGPLIWLLGFALSFRLVEARWFLIGWTLPIVAGALDSYFPRGVGREVGLQCAVLAEVLFFAWFVGRKIGEIENSRAGQNARLFSLQLELERARQVHGALLPRELDFPDSLEAHVFYRPMGGLGGDYYQTAALTDGRRGLLLADVAGHGLAAAMNASTVHIAFHAALGAAADAGDLLTRMNRILAADHNYRFVSAVYVIVNLETLELELSSAGHPDALLHRLQGGLERAGQESPWLGMLADFQYETVRLQAQPGDVLLLYTDGLYEAPYADVEPPEGLIESYAADALASGRALDDVARDLTGRFDQIRGRAAEDDVTLVLLRFRARAQEEAARPAADATVQRDAV